MMFIRFISRKEEEITKDSLGCFRYTAIMMNILPIYQAAIKKQPHRESERDYLIRMARMRQAEERRANRRNVIRRIARRPR
jgi:hypothetical protein